MGFPRARQDREVEAARSAGIGRQQAHEPRRPRAGRSMNGCSNAYGDDDVTVALQPPAPRTEAPRTPKRMTSAKYLFGTRCPPCKRAC